MDTTDDADVFVIFGITGDLAKVMTFQALYRLEARSLLNCPIIGVAVDHWSVDDLRKRAQESIEATGEKLDHDVFDRLAARMSYLAGDFADPDTYDKVAGAIKGMKTPLFYLEIPPFLFGPVVKGLAKADLIRDGRVVVEKPFGHDLASARELAAEMHQYVQESQLYRIDHFLGKPGLEEVLLLRFANAVLEPVWSRNYLSCVQITMAEQFGVEDRGHFYDRVGALRDVVVNHLLQLTSAATMEAPAGADPQTIKHGQVALWNAVHAANPTQYVRGQYDGYQKIDGVAPGSSTETYVALRLDIENWRWDGVPIFIRTGKRLPVTQTEVRLIFRNAPRLGLNLPGLQQVPAPSEIVVRLDPTTGMRLTVNALRGYTKSLTSVDLDLDFGGEEPVPYEVLLHAALIGNPTRFANQDGVEEEWRIVQPLLDNPPQVHPYQPGSWGPAAADELVAAYGGWREPWTGEIMTTVKERTTATEPTTAKETTTHPEMSPFPKIADYAFLSNCHTGALVGLDGSVEWLCVPKFDSPSVFGSLLDREAGRFRFGPYGINHPTTRIYVPGTNVVETTWKTPTGWIVVRDALTMGPHDTDDCVTPHTRPPMDWDASHTLVRTATCIEGDVEVEAVCEPAFDYGRTPATWTLENDRHRAVGSGADVTIKLRSDIKLGIEGNRIRGRHVLNKGDTVYCSLSWSDKRENPRDAMEAVAAIDATVEYWRHWLASARIPDHEYREPIQRSALATKGMTYMPTGATVAASTTSLPETPGGARNWDYRYTWLRDSTFTLQALHWLNLDWEADEYMQFMADLEPTEDGSLQIMYGLDGRRDLTETFREELTGYQGARPVRIGNAAYNQHQNDVFGAALDSILLHTRRSQRLPRRLWPIVQSQAECATKIWKQPDQGIWEARGDPRHYVSSKLMCWVAMDRAASLAEIRGEDELTKKWRATADEIHADILAHGVSDAGALRQHYDTDALDASTLLAINFGFVEPTDDLALKTVDAIAKDLTEDGFVLRYRTGETDDGMSGKEGSFLICSFWLVSALAAVGELARAKDLMEKLLRIGSPLGLYAEEFEPTTARFLGNFPQAFSHLALIEAAGKIILGERLSELE